MPQIGELGPGVWLASGFGGHGLNTTAMAGDLLGRAVVEGDQTWRQFTPFELVWAGGVLGSAAAQVRVWVKRVSDAFEERRAKARELVYRQAREKAREAELAQAAAAPQSPAAPDASAAAFDGPAAPVRYVAPSSSAESETAQEPQPQSSEQAAPRPRRRRKRTQASAQSTVEHDAEA
jgi:thiamine monophosphate kinase